MQSVWGLGTNLVAALRVRQPGSYLALGKPGASAIAAL